MSSTKVQHTPGPWNIGEGGFHVYYVNPRIEAGEEDIDDPRHDSIVATTEPRNAAFSGIDDAEMQANARLIAAAPDLLEELRNLADAFSGEIGADCPLCGGQGAWTDTDPVRMVPVRHTAGCQYRAARIAIAKAEG